MTMEQPITVDPGALAETFAALTEMAMERNDLRVLVAAMWEEITVEGAHRLSTGPLATVLANALESQ